jgi:hypothetical protein
MADTIWGVRFDDCGCDDVHRQPSKAEASFWAKYLDANGQVVTSTDGGTTWKPEH